MTLTDLESWQPGETRDGLRYDGASTLHNTTLLYFTELADVASHGATFCLLAADATAQGIAARRQAKAREFAAAKLSRANASDTICWNVDPSLSPGNSAEAGGTISTGEVLA
jgi:hypothetical protein